MSKRMLIVPKNGIRDGLPATASMTLPTRRPAPFEIYGPLRRIMPALLCVVLPGCTTIYNEGRLTQYRVANHPTITLSNAVEQLASSTTPVNQRIILQNNILRQLQHYADEGKGEAYEEVRSALLSSYEKETFGEFNAALRAKLNADLLHVAMQYASFAGYFSADFAAACSVGINGGCGGPQKIPDPLPHPEEEEEGEGEGEEEEEDKNGMNDPDKFSTLLDLLYRVTMLKRLMNETYDRFRLYEEARPNQGIVVIYPR